MLVDVSYLGVGAAAELANEGAQLRVDSNVVLHVADFGQTELTTGKATLKELALGESLLAAEGTDFVVERNGLLGHSAPIKLLRFEGFGRPLMGAHHVALSAFFNLFIGGV